MGLSRQPVGDKRRWERQWFDVPIRVVADLTDTAVPGRGTKMSEGGMCLFALANLAIGAQIDVELIDSHCGTPVRVSGIVRNRVVYLYGVEFLTDRKENRQQIAQLSNIFGRATGLRLPVYSR
jgi:hypothetical protein